MLHFFLTVLIAIANLVIFVQPVQAMTRIQFYDGDNITVAQNGIKTKVHLACIDAPELAQKQGEEARKVLQNLVEDSYFQLKVLGKDRLGRLIAEIFSDRLNVNKAMVELGYAHYSPQYPKECVGYDTLAAQAKAKHLGIWQDGADVQLPSQFRKNNY